MEIDNARLKEIIEENTLYRDILSRIYIARNISMSHEGVESCLKEIDKLLRDNKNYN